MIQSTAELRGVEVGGFGFVGAEAGVVLAIAGALGPSMHGEAVIPRSGTGRRLRVPRRVVVSVGSVQAAQVASVSSVRSSPRSEGPSLPQSPHLRPTRPAGLHDRK